MVSSSVGCAVHTLRGTSVMLLLFGALLQLLGGRHDNSMLEGGDPFQRALSLLGWGSIILGAFGLYATWEQDAYERIAQYFVAGCTLICIGICVAMFVFESLDDVLMSLKGDAHMNWDRYFKHLKPTMQVRRPPHRLQLPAATAGELAARLQLRARSLPGHALGDRLQRVLCAVLGLDQRRLPDRAGGRRRAGGRDRLRADRFAGDLFSTGRAGERLPYCNDHGQLDHNHRWHHRPHRPTNPPRSQYLSSEGRQLAYGPRTPQVILYCNSSAVVHWLPGDQLYYRFLSLVGLLVAGLGATGCVMVRPPALPPPRYTSCRSLTAFGRQSKYPVGSHRHFKLWMSGLAGTALLLFSLAAISLTGTGGDTVLGKADVNDAALQVITRRRAF